MLFLYLSFSLPHYLIFSFSIFFLFLLPLYPVLPSLAFFFVYFFDSFSNITLKPMFSLTLVFSLPRYAASNLWVQQCCWCLILTLTMASLVWAMSEMTPSVMMRSTKYWEPSWTAAAYLWENTHTHALTHTHMHAHTHTHRAQDLVLQPLFADRQILNHH